MQRWESAEHETPLSHFFSFSQINKEVHYGARKAILRRTEADTHIRLRLKLREHMRRLEGGSIPKGNERPITKS